MIRFSIAICTYNRASLLSSTLSSLEQVDGIDAPDVEVIVVDNNSTDHTKQILDTFTNRLPLSIVTELQQGHCFARNRAVARTTGEYILWTDDDVQLDWQWLVAYREKLEQDSAHSFWGGPIQPKFLAPPPMWIKENWERLAGCFAARDLGLEPRPLDAEHLPYGANFAVRRQLCQQFPFDTQLGRKGNHVVGEDERDFLLRLLQAGHTGSWTPSARLEHLIPPQRTTLEYIAKYFAGQARVQNYRGQQPKLSTRELSQAARHHWLRWQLTRWSCRSPIWLEHWIKLSMFKEWESLSQAARK
ncbi:MAG: glycosyltransferase [Pirellulaceae bacterium]|nr:glycosyltransferase [Pirellulaceae bacterium]